MRFHHAKFGRRKGKPARRPRHQSIQEIISLVFADNTAFNCENPVKDIAAMLQIGF